MPRLSLRRKVLENLARLQEERATKKAIRGVLHDESSEGNSTLSGLLNTGIEDAYYAVSGRRYLWRNKYRRGKSEAIFHRDLNINQTEEQLPWLNDDEFLEKYRMHRSSFWELVDRIKDHSIFQKKAKQKKMQAPVAHQLLVLLHYLGTSGSGASNPRIRNVFWIGRGTAQLYRNRCVIALRSLRDQTIYWPDDNEKKVIARRIYNKYGWPNCIAIADGTLFPLTFEPKSVDAPDYSGRKFAYSLTVMIVNDDQKRIRYYLAGFPGSAHDNRVYKATKLARSSQQFFGTKYYLVGDSAFETSMTVVPAFKCPRGHTLDDHQMKFNTQLGKLRVLSEHTIGILKGRFPWLRSIPMQISDDPMFLKRILKYIDCCIILHNILINIQDEDVPEEWIDLDDDASDMAEATGDEGLMDPIADEAPKHERRNRLFEYFRDFVF
eukprot:scaffold34094_cov42-Attheya_sp.AAC.3